MESFFEKKLIESAAEFVKKERVEKAENIRPAEIENADESTKKIFDIQKEKQRIMDELYGKMQRIRRGKKIETAGQKTTAEFDKENNLFVLKQGGKEPQIATLGDLITDASWGKEYEISESAPLEIKEAYYNKAASIKVSELFDKQITVNKLSSDSVDHGKKMAYTAIQEKSEKGIEKSAGLIFEKVLKNLLLQLQYDIPDWEIKVERADAAKDVEYKIDFIIKVANKRRGAKIQEENEKDIDSPLVLGIQFTIIPSSAGRYKHKEWQTQQARRYLQELKIDDLILISLPTDNREIKKKYKTWVELGEPVGGPERLYDTNTKITILKAVLQKMGIDDIIETQEEKLKEYYNSKLAPVTENQ